VTFSLFASVWTSGGIVDIEPKGDGAGCDCFHSKINWGRMRNKRGGGQSDSRVSRVKRLVGLPSNCVT
jgi:hypothetical protein